MNYIKILFACLGVSFITYNVYSAQFVDSAENSEVQMLSGGYYRITYTEELDSVDYGSYTEVTYQTVANCMPGGTSSCTKGKFQFKKQFDNGIVNN